MVARYLLRYHYTVSLSLPKAFLELFGMPYDFTILSLHKLDFGRVLGIKEQWEMLD